MLEQQLKSQAENREAESVSLKERCKQLGEENQNLAQEVRGLNTKILALQAQSPEVSQQYGYCTEI